MHLLSHCLSLGTGRAGLRCGSGPRVREAGLRCHPANHKLSGTDDKLRRYDASGNTIAIGDATLAYDAVGRLASASEQGRLLVSYGYDAANQRIARTEAAGPKTGLILYDEGGHWLADYDSNGTITRQAVWMGDWLVGLVDAGKLLYVEPDHLGSPRVVVDPVRGVTVWRWRPSDDPFGTALPSEDPDADGARFVFDLRFPGQRYDALTGLHYNYYRDYDPGTGRYVQVDPTGLAGGIHPYLYANGAPLIYTDPTGEVAFVPILIGLGAGAAFDYGVSKWKESHCGCEESTLLGMERSAALGAANAAFGPTAIKPRTGIAGGGQAGSRTSPYSQWIHQLGKEGSITKPQRRVLRDVGRGVSRRLPYVSVALAASDLIDAFNCE